MRRKVRKPQPSAFQRFRESRAVKILYDKGILYFVLAFLIPAAIMLNAFRKQGIHPFGDEQMLVVDLWHQYFPFFRVEREKLLTGGSFLYSWQNGMGTNYLALIAYYAASPLNWISVFFDDDHVRDAMTYILAAKIGFCGAFFSCFLRYTYRRRDFSIVVFSSIFALCSYMLGYYWNVMWFDTVALFPLVMLGVTALCREGRWKLYTVSLALSLISNYYIGYFTCIFTMFMFAAAIVIEGKSVRDFFRKLWLIVRSSAVGIGLGAFILLPAYYGLKLTYSVNNHFPEEAVFFEKWTDIFANLISYSEPTAKEGLPNFACGMLAVTLFGVFLFSAGIKLREKISMTLLLALIAVSCNLNVLNYIWHGFHVTNQLPYRYAFIFSFVLAAAAYRAYDIMTRKGIKAYQLVLLAAGPAAVLGLYWLNASKTEEGFAFEGAFKSSVIITGAYILIFTAAKLFPFKNELIRRSLMNIAVAAAVFSELVSNAALGVKTVGSSGYTSYPTANKSVQTLLDEMRGSDDSPFYRTEMTSTYTLNDSALYGYYGVSQFSSTANVSVTRLFRRLGLYSSEAGNRYYYRNSTPVVNDLLGINYIISRNGYLNNSAMSLEHIADDDSVHLYRSLYSMSLGFMMDRDILLLEDKEAANPFEYQNDVIRLATGMDYSVFTAQPVKLVTYNNMETVKNGYGSYSFTVTEAGQKASASYEFSGLDGAYLYGYATNGSLDTVSAKCDGANSDTSVSVKDYPVAFPMGNGQEGSTISAELSLRDDVTTGSYNFVVYALRQDAFELAYDKLADEQLEITEFTDTKITGNISVNKRGILYLSIPYEKGWSVFIDGQKTSTFKVLNAMLGAEVGAGDHEIVLKYSPDGFSTGLVISGAAALVLVMLLLADMAERRKRKRKGAYPREMHNEIKYEMDDAFSPEVTNEESESNDGLPGH